MKRLGRFIPAALTGLGVAISALLLFTSLMSDKLTAREAAERIAAADEPCRAAYERALDLREAGASRPEATSEAAREGEPVCRGAFETLDRIIVFIPSKGAGDEARAKKSAIKDCAALSRTRADLLAHVGGLAPPGGERPGVEAMQAELVRSDEACKRSYARLLR